MYNHSWKQISPDNLNNLYCELCGSGSFQPSETCIGEKIGMVKRDTANWLKGKIPDMNNQERVPFPANEITPDAPERSLADDDIEF
jgi:hypothetical protein